MSIWTITGGDLDNVDVSTLGISKLARKLKSLAVDMVTFEAPLNFDATPLIAAGQTVVIRKSGALWFTGVMTIGLRCESRRERRDEERSAIPG